MTRSPDLPTRLGPAEVAWAVHLGCSTPQRLAREWGITAALARSLILGAVEAGLVKAHGPDFWASRPEGGQAGAIGGPEPGQKGATVGQPVRPQSGTPSLGVALWRRIAQDRRDRQSETTRAMHEKRKAMMLRRTA